MKLWRIPFQTMTFNPARKNGIALVAVSLASLMFGLEISSVPAILPTLEKVLRGDFKDAQWIMNAYTLACTTVLMATGTLADRLGRKRLFMISVALFGVTSLVCGIAQGVAVLIASRFLQGLSGGAMLICQVAVLSHQFRQGQERASAFAWWGIIFGIGLGFGPIIGSAIAALSSWRWVFLVHVILAGVTLLLGAGSIQESRDPAAKSLDLAGILTLSVTVFCLVFFITQGSDLGFTSPGELGIIGIAIASLVAFFLAEKISSRPMFDFTVFRIRSFSGALLGSVGMNISFWPFMIYLPIYFQSGLGYDSMTAGLSLLAYTLPTLVAPPLGERLLVRYKSRIVIPMGLLTIGLGFILMKLGNGSNHASWLTMLPGCVIAGFGLGLTNTTVTNTTTGSVSSTRAGMASGIDMSARLITLAINIAMMGFILVEGIFSYLIKVVPIPEGRAQLRSLAKRIASGEVASLQKDFPSLVGSPSELVHAALIHGFGLVMLYAGIGVWFIALISFAVFGPREMSLQKESPTVRRVSCESMSR